MASSGDLVLEGGTVYTADPRRPWARLLVSRGGWVTRVGAAGGSPPGGATVPVVDLRGRLAVPGFHDAHCHLEWGTLARRKLDLEGTRSIEAVLGAVRERASELPGGAWVEGRGWDEDLLAEGRPPTRDELDEASPDHPVLLRRVCGHAGVASSRALAEAGIDRGTPDPEGGTVVRDEEGRATGLLRETALDRVVDVVPTPPRSERVRALADGCRRAARLGVTAVQDHLGEPSVYRTLAEDGRLLCRASLWADLRRPFDELEAVRAGLEVDDPMIRFGLLKGFLDGSLGARTAALGAPYADAPAERGTLRWDREELVERVGEADGRGFRVGLHAIGDRAVALALDAYEAVRERGGGSGIRHRVEHVQVVRPADVHRLVRLGAWASVQPHHRVQDGSVAGERLGRDRGTLAYPLRSLLEAGAEVAIGTDYPVSPLDPLPGLLAAVGADGEGPRGGPEAISPREAIDAATRQPARAAGRGDDLGVLAPARRADVAVLDRNVLGEPEALRDARVDLTILGGRVVFDRHGETDPAVRSPHAVLGA